LINYGQDKTDMASPYLRGHCGVWSVWTPPTAKFFAPTTYYFYTTLHDKHCVHTTLMETKCEWQKFAEEKQMLLINSLCCWCQQVSFGCELKFNSLGIFSTWQLEEPREEHIANAWLN